MPPGSDVTSRPLIVSGERTRSLTIAIQDRCVEQLFSFCDTIAKLEGSLVSATLASLSPESRQLRTGYTYCGNRQVTTWRTYHGPSR